MSDQIKTINPATEEELKSYSLMSADETAKIIEDCHQAFLSWKNVDSNKRAEIIKSIGESLKKHKQELVNLMTQEMGKLLKQGEQEIDLCIGICDFTANNGPSELKDEQRDLLNGGKGLITHSPIGIVYGIQPWNFPTYQVLRYTIANLMAGNAVLLKHAQNVTGSALLIEEIIKDSDLPENLFRVLVIDHEESDRVIGNELVRGVTLTGSPTAGKIIAEKAGKKLKKTVLELGANDAYIILKDADLDLAVKTCVQGRIYNNGETCVAAKRFIVEEEIYDEFKEAFVEQMKKVTYGDPTDENSQLGPIAREDLRDQLHEQVTKSVEKGAKILCGGEVPNKEGFYYPATVLENLSVGMPAYDDELFGPVASLIKAKDEKDALKIANSSRFGLGGGIFTKDEDKAIELAKYHFDTGMVNINSYGLAHPNMPFGGVKNSGYGREHGGFGVKEFTNAKAILLN